MSTPSLVSGNRMLRTADWLWDREQEAADNRALAEYDRREAIERSVTRAELFEEATETFTRAQDDAFMQALARGNASDLHLIFCLLDQMKTRIVMRRVNGGE